MKDVKIVLEKGATMPSYANEGDAGADIFPIMDYSIPPNARGMLIKTGIKIQLPNMYEIQVRPKSGNSIKTPLRIVLGTIDSGYRGEIGVIVDNISNEWIKVSKEKAIAQLVLKKVPTMNFIKVNELDDTDRGIGGFGSTGRGI